MSDDVVQRGRQLRSWKQIAAFFRADVRTVKRWEITRGLPVHRPGGARAAVFAYDDELQLWLKRNDAQASRDPDETAMLAGDRPFPPLPDPDEPLAQMPILPEVDSRTAERWSRPAAAQNNWPGLAVIAAAAAAIFVASISGGILYYGGVQPVVKFLTVTDGSVPHEPSAAAKAIYRVAVYNLETRTADGLRRAVTLFTQATNIDPLYAEAYARLADTYNLISQYTPMPADEAYGMARAAAERALALEPNSAAGLAALAFNDFYWKHDFSRSGAAFERALALDPSVAQVHHWYALTLMHTGKFTIPLHEIDRAQAIDPSSKSILANKALILFHAGRADEAETILKQMQAAEPTLRSPPEYLATLYLAERRYPDFLREYRRAAEASEGDPRKAIGAAAEAAFDIGGGPAMLSAMFDAQKQVFAQGREPAYKLAMTAAMIGDRDRALEYLAISLSRREDDILGLYIEPAFADLRRDPKFRKIAAAVGFST